ncbi:NUDIX domain-containing protein [bacterium]|nr:NUDIX domain-containing protein [bacterium]
MTHYCVNCATRLETKIIDGRDREICPSCGWVNYEILKVSAGVRIEKDGRLLLVQRGINPWKGLWYLPAGFVEVEEEPYQGAMREAYEETGLKVKLIKLVDVYTYTDDPRGNGIVVLYDAEIESGELTVTPETMDAGFFSVDEVLKMKFAGLTVTKEVNDWLHLKGSEKEVQA